MAKKWNNELTQKDKYIWKNNNKGQDISAYWLWLKTIKVATTDLKDQK